MTPTNCKQDPNGYAKGIQWQPKFTRILIIVARDALLILAKGLELILKENDSNARQNN